MAKMLLQITLVEAKIVGNHDGLITVEVDPSAPMVAHLATYQAENETQADITPAACTALLAVNNEGDIELA